MNILNDNSNNFLNTMPTSVPSNNAVSSSSSTIDQPNNSKNNTSEGETLGQKMNDIKNFAIYLATFIGSVLLYFVIGIVLLYLSKVFQSNLIPDDLGCFPYTDNEGNMDELSVNPVININRIFLKESNSLQSEKLVFDYKENKNTIFLNRLIHKWTSIYKPEEKTTGLLYWIGSFIQRFYYSNMYLLAGFFGILKTLTFGFDFLFIVLGPIALGIFIVISMLLIYPVYFYSFLPQLYVITCKNISTQETPNTWQPQIGSNATYVNWFVNVAYLIFWFVLALIVCIPPLAQVLSLIMIFVILFSGLVTAQGEKVIDEKTMEPYGFFDFFKDTIKFKSWFFMAIVTIGVVQGVPLFFDKLTSGVVMFVLILLIIFELMGFEYNPLPIYSKIVPEYLSPEIKKAGIVEKKGCKMMPISFDAIPMDPNQKGFLDRWTDWLVEKGFMIWSFTPTGRAATIAGKAGPLLLQQAKLGALGNLTNIATNTANEAASNALNNVLAKSPLAQSPLGQAALGQSPLAQAALGQSPLALSPLGQSPLAQAALGQTPLAQGLGQIPLSSAQKPPPKPMKPVSFGKRRGGGQEMPDYTKIAQTLKKILRN
jgi:hypothetical protein